MDTSDENRLLTTREVARILEVSPKTLEKWRSEGKGPAFVTLSGRAVRYRFDKLRSWIEAVTKTPGAS